MINSSIVVHVVLAYIHLDNYKLSYFVTRLRLLYKWLVIMNKYNSFQYFKVESLSQITFWFPPFRKYNNQVRHSIIFIMLLMIYISCREFAAGKNGNEIMLTLLTSTNYEWTKSDNLITALRAPLLRLCARYNYGINKILKCVSHDHLGRKL